ncbi:MAG: hypothetical protein M3328_13690, partial [Chloroflexota bacterium]|nr:hypothetical protein [Chloroflexota bacterium]
CQGALIKHGHARPVGAGGIVRLGALLISLVFFGWLGTSVVRIEPAAIAVLAMLGSVTAEALAVQGWTSRLVKTMPEATPGKPPPTWADIRRFFFPLSGTAIMSTLVQPTMRAGIASAAVAWAAAPNNETVAVAVAAYQTAWSMAFLAFGPTLSITQASIAWSGSPDPTVRERGPRVIVGVGLALGALMALFAFTPLSEWIFSTVIQSPPQTAHLAAEVARWLVPMPVLHSVSFMLRGRLIAMHKPQAVRRAQLVDLLAVVAVVQLAVASFSPLPALLQGASAAPVAAIAYNLMLCADIGILLLSLRGQDRARRQLVTTNKV